MNKIYRKISKLFNITIAASLFLASCNFGLSKNVDEIPLDSENTLVTVEIDTLKSSGSVARTALPNHDLNNYLYNFSYKSEDSEEIFLCEKESLTNLNSTKKELRSGKKYTFNISAWSADSKILEGSTVVENLSGDIYNLSVILTPVKGLLGTAKIVVDYPDDGVINNIKYVYSTNRNAIPTEVVIPAAGLDGNKTFEIKKENIPSGVSQYIIFELYDNQNSIVYRRVESLYVAGGQTSVSNIVIDKSYYYRKPVTVTVKKDGVVYSSSSIAVDIIGNTKKYSLEKDSSGYYVGEVPAGTYSVYIKNVNTNVVVEANKSATVELFTINLPSSKVTLAPADENSGVIITDDTEEFVVPKNGDFTVKVSLNKGYKTEVSATIGNKPYNTSVTLNQKDVGASEIAVTGIVPIEYEIKYYNGAINADLSGLENVHYYYTIESDFKLPILPNTTDYNFGGWEIFGTGTVITEIKPGRTEKLTLDAKWEEKSSASFDIIYLFEGIDNSEYASDSSIKENTKGSGKIDSQTNIVSPSAYAPVISGFNNPVITNAVIKEDGSTQVTVKYARKTVSVTFDAGENGKFGSDVTKSITKKYGAAISAVEIPVPTRTDYKLIGWNPSLPAHLTIPATPVTYTAVWEQEYAGYTIQKFYQNKNDDGYTENVAERDSSKKAKIGEIVTAAAPLVSGFTAKPVESVEVAADGNSVVKVYYDRKTITITLDMDGGAISGNDNTKFTGKYDTTTSLPSGTPVKEGWEFVGWIKAGDTDVSALPITYPSADVTYKAKYRQTVASFTVKIFEQKIDGSYTTVEAKSFTTTGNIGENTNVTQGLVTTNYPLPTGFEWDYVENKTLASSGTVVNVFYKRKMVTYTFSGNGGGWSSESSKVVNVRYGSNVSVPENPVYGTLIFAGWGASSITDTITTPDSTAGLNNKTYYAVWKSKIDTGDASDPIDPSKLNVDFTSITNGTEITSTFNYISGTDPRDWELVWQVNDRIVTGQTTNVMKYSGVSPFKYEVKLIAYYKGIPYIKTHTVELR